jgi:uncharacterized protein
MPSFASTTRDTLTDSQIDELEDFLMHELESDEGMTLDMLDGFLHAIVIGPTTLMPSQWLPSVWGEGGGVLPVGIDRGRIEWIFSLIMGRYNYIIQSFQSDPPAIAPIWHTRRYKGEEYDDGEMWAYGFVAGMKLSWKDWQPMLDTAEGQAWFRPIGLLAESDFSADQDALTEFPDQREALSKQMLDSVLAMHAYWLPLRLAVHERRVAKTFAKKVGRNEACPAAVGINSKSAAARPLNCID